MISSNILPQPGLASNNINTDYKYSSVSLVYNADLFIFIVEKNCSQTCTLPNMARIYDEANILGNLSPGRAIDKQSAGQMWFAGFLGHI